MNENDTIPEITKDVLGRKVKLETTLGVLVALGYGVEILFALARVPGQASPEDMATYFEARKAINDVIEADKAKFDEETGGVEEWPEHLFGSEVH